MKATTTLQYLDALHAHFHITSDYKLGLKLGCSRGLMSSYRTGKSHFDDYMCMKIAEILGLPPLQVIADIQAERERRPHVKVYWEHLAQQLRMAARATAAGVILSAGVLTSGGISDAYVNSESANVYYVKWLLVIAAAFAALWLAHPFVRRKTPNIMNNTNLGGLTDGSGSANPAPARAAHPTAGGGIVRRIPAHLQTLRSGRPATGRGDHGAALQSRVSGRLAGLSDHGWRADSAGRIGRASECAGELPLSTAAARGPRVRTGKTNCAVKSAAAGQSDPRLFSAADFAAARATRDRFPVSRSGHASA
jgi:hypothetical protein